MNLYAGEKGRAFYERCFAAQERRLRWALELNPGDSYDGCDGSSHVLARREVVYASIDLETDVDGPPIPVIGRLYVDAPPSESNWIVYDVNLHGAGGTVHSAIHCAGPSAQ